MKRKSGQHRADKRKQARAADSDGPIIREADSFTQLELAPMQAVILTGSAVLEVTAGCLSVFGALITPETGPIKLHAPTNFGRGLQLTALAAADTEPPHQQQQSRTQAVLHSLWPATEQQQQQGYAVVDAASEAAPVTWQVSPTWGQAVGDLVAAAAAAAGPSQAAGGSISPLSVAVSGSKGAGKSAFARLLVNSLLCQGQHPVVAFLDLDPGQPEFTPPGLLSLQLLRQPVFGPPHLQHQQPLLAFFQGDTSSQSEPGRYLQAVQSLVQRYRNLTTADLAASGTAAVTLPTATAATAAVAVAGAVADGCAADAVPAEPLEQLPPLVINTPGWITGLGLELLAEVLRCAQPTHVVQLQTSNPKKNLPAAAWWLDTAAAAGDGSVLPLVLQVPSAAAADGAVSGSAAAPADSCVGGFSGDTTQTAAVKGGAAKGVSAAAVRNLMWLAWAERAAAAATGAGGGSADADPDQTAPAVAGPAAGPAGAAAAAGAGAVAAAGAAVGRAAYVEDFAGVAGALAAAVPMVVSLQDVHVELLHAQVAGPQMPVALNGAVVGLARSSSTASSQQQEQVPECLGLGLVRAVDGPRQELYVLTDLSEQQLQHVDMLQAGRLQLPDKLLEAQGFASPYQGLFCLAAAATGAGQIKSRNNLLRSSQLLR